MPHPPRPGVIDLRSDTVTLPTPEMRAAMAAAPLGDDVFGEDPTVNALQERAAALLGKEAALFVPSGTMGNLVAVLAQTRPGDAIILSQVAHSLRMEAGNLAMIGGLLVSAIPTSTGLLDAQSVRERIVTDDDPHHARTTLVAIENTAGATGGVPYPLETVRAIRKIARANDLSLHCDGARLFNAAIATGHSAADFAAPCDTVSFCFSKGLGAPVGSIVVGNAETIARANRFRKMLGGGMRQAGVIAAAGLYALEHHIDRLADDHRRAAAFREALEGVEGLRFPFPSPTNMVFIEVRDAPAFMHALAQRGVLVYDTSPTHIRVVFHLGIADAHVEMAAQAFRDVAAALS